MSYLRKRGLGAALLELQRHLDDEEKHNNEVEKVIEKGAEVEVEASNSNKRSKPNDASDVNNTSTSKNSNTNTNSGTGINASAKSEESKENPTTSTSMDEALKKAQQKEDEEAAMELERLEEKYKDQETALTLMTGGGIGYDQDAAPAILSWTNGTVQGDGSANNRVHIKQQKQPTSTSTSASADDNENGVKFEDTEADSEKGRCQQDEARRCIRAFNELHTWVLSLPDEDPSAGLDLHTLKNRLEASVSGSGSSSGSGEMGASASEGTKQAGNRVTTSTSTSASHQYARTASFIPADVKPELLSVTFPLLVHTYCDLLESNLEESANTLLSTYRYIHEPRYPTEFRDLDKCNTTAGILKLNQIVVLANEALSKAKQIRLSYDKRKMAVQVGSSDPNVSEQIEYLQQQYELVVKRHSTLLRQLKDYPFLKRVRSVKLQLNLSSMTFGFLARFLRCEDLLLPMSVLLQTRCQVLVQTRDPSPFVPACILEDMTLPPKHVDVDNNTEKEKQDSGGEEEKDKEVDSQTDDLRWAAPVYPKTRSNELGDLELSVLKKPEDLPFPKFYLDKEYDTTNDYENSKKRVEFNRALLTNGFRRLAALEVKDEYEIGMRKRGTDQEKQMDQRFGNPLEPSIMLSTLCSSVENAKIKDPLSPLEEPSLELTCAKLCPPDGRRVAAGCSDSAIRIWSMDSWSSLTGKGLVDSINGASSNESVVVLVGHKSGLPVFDIDWNKDGRTLISAGGDGTLRLWDTRAVGSYGERGVVTARKSGSNGEKETFNLTGDPNTHVPGAKAESRAQQHGSALACYQGHAPSTPVWSVAIAPCGYYFASAGADSTARLWCTDRTTPIRIFAGHYSENVNCVTFHPNCNYIMTGSDDKTVRMWDVQSGNCVRLLSGCGAGVNKLEVSPSGQYVAGADYSGFVHIWDLRNGRKLNEFKHHVDPTIHTNKLNRPTMIQSMSFSPCGTAIATSGDDSNIHIWNTLSLGNHPSNPEFVALKSKHVNVTRKAADKPFKTFRTNRTSILDLKYTKRNLLLSVGKYH